MSAKPKKTKFDRLVEIALLYVVVVIASWVLFEVCWWIYSILIEPL